MTDFEDVLRRNLERVFNEHDAARRMKAIGELYAEDAVLYEPDAEVRGHAAISSAVTTLLEQLPASFVFTATGPALGHHGVGRLRWQAGPPGGPIAVTGTDVARIENSKIQTLHVFIDPNPA